MLGGIGALLIGLGIIAVIIGVYMRMRASRVAAAPFVKTGEAAAKGSAAANPKGGISAEGNVSCPTPLMSPVSNKMCLYYEVKVTAEWKDGDTHKTKELSKEKRAAQFAIDDGSGPVWIDAREGGDFTPSEVSDQTQSTSLMGGITGQDLMFGSFRVSTGMLSLGTKYNVRETILPAVQRLYACGKVGSSNEILAPSWRQLLLTNKTRDDYLSHAMQSAKYAFMAAGGMVVVGGILGVVAALTGDSGKAAAAASSATAAAATADTAAPAAAASATAKPAGQPGTPAKPPPTPSKPPTKKK
jgi:hypothetical protein